jgi:hypothetical protein
MEEDDDAFLYGGDADQAQEETGKDTADDGQVSGPPVILEDSASKEQQEEDEASDDDEEEDEDSDSVSTSTTDQEDFAVIWSNQLFEFSLRTWRSSSMEVLVLLLAIMLVPQQHPVDL